MNGYRGEHAIAYRRSGRRGGMVVIGALVMSVAHVASADAPVIRIPTSTVVRGEPGSVHHIASVAVDPDLRGLECRVAARAANQSSVHPDTDLVVSSGGEEVILRDVERSPEVTTIGQGTLLLGDQVGVAVVLGPDGVMSAGMRVELTCSSPTTSTTTTTVDTSTTMAPTTTEPPTTTTTVDATTTTVAPAESTTSTSVMGETTTTTIDVRGTTTVTTGPSVSSTTGETLPFTGAEPGATAGIGLSLIAAGGIALALVGRPIREDPTD